MCGRGQHRVCHAPGGPPQEPGELGGGDSGDSIKTVLGGWIEEELALKAPVSTQKPPKSPSKGQNADLLLTAASEGQVLARGRILLRSWSAKQQKQHLSRDPLGMQIPRPHPSPLEPGTQRRGPAIRMLGSPQVILM